MNKCDKPNPYREYIAAGYEVLRKREWEEEQEIRHITRYDDIYSANCGMVITAEQLEMLRENFSKPKLTIPQKMGVKKFTLRDIESLIGAATLYLSTEVDIKELDRFFSQWKDERLNEL